MSPNHGRVLIIDDHESFRSVAPEAVVLDLRLRDGSGFDVCRRLTRADPRRAVLLVSADEPDRGRAHIGSCGARGFVLKSRLASADLVSLLGAA